MAARARSGRAGRPERILGRPVPARASVAGRADPGGRNGAAARHPATAGVGELPPVGARRSPPPAAGRALLKADRRRRALEPSPGPSATGARRGARSAPSVQAALPRSPERPDDPTPRASRETDPGKPRRRVPALPTPGPARRPPRTHGGSRRAQGPAVRPRRRGRVPRSGDPARPALPRLGGETAGTPPADGRPPTAGQTRGRMPTAVRPDVRMPTVGAADVPMPTAVRPDVRLPRVLPADGRLPTGGRTRGRMPTVLPPDVRGETAARAERPNDPSAIVAVLAARTGLRSSRAAGRQQPAARQVRCDGTPATAVGAPAGRRSSHRRAVRSSAPAGPGRPYPC